MRAQILSASAGSGKTYRLAYKFVHDTIKYYRDKPYLYRAILAVTFTNKATEEMKSRILKEINDLIVRPADSSYMADLKRDLGFDEAEIVKRARSIQTKILHDYSRFTILTIDKFFQRILRAFIRELGIDLNYNIEIETSTVLTRSADSLIDDITGDDTLRQWIMEFAQEKIDDNSQWDIRRDLLALGRELFNEQSRQTVMNSTSKEELQKAIREAEKRSARARADMKAAAEKALEIMDRAGVCPTDFAGKSRSFAKYFSAIAAGDVKEPTATARQRAASPDGWAAKGSAAQAAATELQPLLAEICDTFDRNRRLWSTLPLVKSTYRSYALLQDIYKRVRDLCEEEGIMLLSETKYILSRFVAGNDAPFIYEKTGNRFERFMIDEFQDTSIREWENFVPLLQNAMSQSEDTSVLIVGDVKQSIYRWRGGDWRILHDGAREALGAADTEVVHLRENYRSLPEVVEFNNRTIGRVVAADNRQLNTLIGEAAARGDLSAAACERLRDTLADAYRDHGQIPRRREEYPGYVSVESFADRPPVVERICELLDKGFRPCDIMILVRSATDGAKIAAELLDFRSRNEEERYRFDVTTQEALVIGTAPVSIFVTAALRLAVNPDDSLSRACYNRFLGRPFDCEPDAGERSFFRSLRLLPPEEAFERIVMRHDLERDERLTAYLQALHEQIIAFCANRIADIPLFLRWWDEQGASRSLSIERSASTVEIMTVHKAKGLEKRAVIIPWCSWQLDPKSGGNVQNIVWAEARSGEAAGVGRFPVRYKRAMAESEFSAEYYRELVYAHVDNVNLLYVALTRAAESLHVFVPQRGRHIGSLLLQCLAAAPGEEGRRTSSEAGERYEFGEFTGPAAAKSGGEEPVEHAVLEHYRTRRADLRLRLPSQRYFEEGETELSPRNFGILMHRAFQEADDEAGIRQAVLRMQEERILSAEDAATLQDMIDRALAHPVVREWFGGGWERIRNEHGIVVPGEGGTRRPDRVMVAGDRAVVVDYKFGGHDDGRYRRQLCDYMRLLRKMGYVRVEGYLWFVKRGEILPVEP